MVYQRASCVRGYHIYVELWEAAIVEVLVCEREPRNRANRYVVAVKRSWSLIGSMLLLFTAGSL